MNKRRLTLVVAALVLSLMGAPAAAGASAPASPGPEPGEFITLEPTIPVNIVLIGFDRDSIDSQTLLDRLPATYTPVVRFPRLYGLPGRDLGLKYTFDYRLRHATSRFEDRFFDHLSSIGTPGGRTFFQQAYNDMANNVLDVGDSVLYIDAPSVEAWLADNAHRLRVDVRRSYTVFFINWHGRDDFQFHVYTKTDEPDPDTGVNFGERYDAAKMIAWGGTHSRTWFYDLSAGPEAWAGSFDVDHADIDGDGAADGRVPPIWEYAEGGYTAPADLSNDLGVLTRFVAINLLFTTSPLYDPLVTAPGPGGGKVAHVALFEDDPDRRGIDSIQADFIHAALQDFEPYYAWETALAHHDPIKPDVERAFRIWTGRLAEDDCWNDFGFTFAELFCFFSLNRETYLPGYGEQDYVVGTFAFNTTDAHAGSQFGFGGIADDNYVDGTQSFAFIWIYPFLESIGYGFSTATIHEVGHHLGVSHPHDGYDSEFGFTYGSFGDFYFAWSGDQSHTVMSYMQLANGFGRFNRDNLYRWETAAYLNQANALLDDVLAHPDARRVRHPIRAAQQDMDRSIKSFNRWEYVQAAAYAFQARNAVLKAAGVLGVTASDEFAALRISTQPIDVHMDEPVRYAELQP